MEPGNPAWYPSVLHDHIGVVYVEKHQGEIVQDQANISSLYKVPDPSLGKEINSPDNRAGGQVEASNPCSRESHHCRFPQCSCVTQAASSDAVLGRGPSPLSAACSQVAHLQQRRENKIHHWTGMYFHYPLYYHPTLYQQNPGSPVLTLSAISSIPRADLLHCPGSNTPVSDQCIPRSCWKWLYTIPPPRCTSHDPRAVTGGPCTVWADWSLLYSFTVPRLVVRRKCHLLQQILNPSEVKPVLTHLSRLPGVTPESSTELNTSWPLW